MHKKYFSELTTDELYEILRLRAEIFIIEQKSFYLDPDGRDKEAIHLWMEDQGEMIAYARVLPKTSDEPVSIGRVIAKYRRRGLGSAIMKAAIQAAEEDFHADEILIDAQVYAVPFYRIHEFIEEGEEYILDDLPHIHMRRR